MSSCDSDHVVMVDIPDKITAFQSLLNSSGSTPVFAFFYSESCPHCITLMKIFTEYRKQCALQQSKTVMVFINGRTASDLFAKYNIGPVPHTILFKNGRDIKHIIGADAPALACAMKSAGIELSRRD